jgi:hypothetical protein
MEVLIMANRTLAKFTKILLDLMFWLGIASTCALPWIFRWAGQFYANLVEYYWLNVVLFLIVGICCVLIVRELRAMFATVLRDDCFVRANVTSLRRMGFLALAIAFTTAVRLFFIFSPATLVIIVVFFISALFSLVLAGIFDTAVNYKLENDLMI